MAVFDKNKQADLSTLNQSNLTPKEIKKEASQLTNPSEKVKQLANSLTLKN